MARFRFEGACEFDSTSGEVRREGTLTRLEPQPAALLALLAERAGELVTYDQIQRAIWRGDTHVNFREGVHYCIKQVRAALGDRAQAPRIIETIPRRGYRLRRDALLARDAAELRAAGSKSHASPHFEGSLRSRAPKWLAIACLGLSLASAVFFLDQRPNNHHQVAVTVLRTIHDFIY